MAKLPLAARSATSSRSPYCPKQFDIIRIQFNPQAGREQAEARPAFVLSPLKYNEITRLCILCQITSQVKGYPFEVALPAGGRATGVVLSDQIKSFDWLVRGAEFLEHRPEIAPQVTGKLKALLGL